MTDKRFCLITTHWAINTATGKEVLPSALLGEGFSSLICVCNPQWETGPPILMNPVAVTVAELTNTLSTHSSLMPLKHVRFQNCTQRPVPCWVLCASLQEEAGLASFLQGNLEITAIKEKTHFAVHQGHTSNKIHGSKIISFNTLTLMIYLWSYSWMNNAEFQDVAQKSQVILHKPGYFKELTEKPNWKLSLGPAGWPETKLPLKIPASHIKEPVWVPATLLPTQCPATLPRQAVKEDPSIRGPCHPRG